VVPLVPDRYTWSEIFGKDANEVFVAWHVAGYIEKVASADKNKYPLSMCVNVWLDDSDRRAKPWDYASSGPVAKMVPIYQVAAPHLGFLTPDIYHPDPTAVCDAFHRMDSSLFIPESLRTAIAGVNAFYAIGEGALYQGTGRMKGISIPSGQTKALEMGGLRLVLPSFGRSAYSCLRRRDCQGKQ
jgi:hypothetical protein